MATGTATLDFGAFPGSYDTSIAVTGQGPIVAGSLVEAWVRPVATADHSADEHMLEEFKVFAGNIVAATGFTIYGWALTRPEPLLPGPGGPSSSLVNIGSNDLAPRMGGKTPRVYGLFTVAWAWV